MIHKAEAQKRVIKSSQQAASSAPAPLSPSFASGEQGLMQLPGQGTPAWFGGAGTGLVPAALGSPPWLWLCGGAVLSLWLGWDSQCRQLCWPGLAREAHCWA